MDAWWKINESVFYYYYTVAIAFDHFCCSIIHEGNLRKCLTFSKSKSPQPLFKLRDNGNSDTIAFGEINICAPHHLMALTKYYAKTAERQKGYID